MDLKIQNVEKIRACLESVLGRDSAGTEAMRYVTSFEDQLAQMYPQDKNMVGEDHSTHDESPLAILYPPRPTPTPPTDAQEVQNKARQRSFASFSTEMSRTTMLRMNKCYESYITSGDIGDAKKAFALGYIVLALKPPVSESGQIEDTMATLLDSLTVKK
jgi:hypothetical protein